MDAHSFTRSARSAPARNPVPVSVADGEPARPHTVRRPGKATRTYTPAQHARRVAWGNEWGKVGAEWKRQHNPKG